MSQVLVQALGTQHWLKQEKRKKTNKSQSKQQQQQKNSSQKEGNTKNPKMSSENIHSMLMTRLKKEIKIEKGKKQRQKRANFI